MNLVNCNGTAILNWSDPRTINMPVAGSELQPCQPHSSSIVSKIKKGWNIAEGVYNYLNKIRFHDHNLNQPVEDALQAGGGCPFARTFIVDWNLAVTTDRAAMKAILSPHRNEGTFLKIDPHTHSLLNLSKRIFTDTDIEANDFILTCDPDSSKIYRRLISGYLGRFQIKNEYIPQIAMVIEKELDEWERIAAAAGEVNVNERCQMLTSAVISNLFLGYDGSYASLCHAINVLIQDSSRPLTGVGPSAEEFANAREVLVAAIKQVKEKKSTPFIQEAMESSFFTGKGKEHRLDLLIFAIFVAGQETTAVLLMFVIWELAHNRPLQEKLRQGIFDASNPYGTDLLHKTIKEGLRLYPPVGGLGRFLGSDCVLATRFHDDDRIEYRRLNAGQRPLASMFFAGRNPVVWGDDADLFYPERFDNISQDLPHFPFGAGSNMCPGRNLAWEESVLFLSLLLSRFHISTNMCKDEVRPIQQMTTCPNVPIKIILSKSHCASE